MKLIYQASLVGNIFTTDSIKVLDILKGLTLGSDAETNIKGLKCGIKEMQELQGHYCSTSEGARRKKVSRAVIRNILCKNKTTFIFEKYITKLEVFFMCWVNMVSHSTMSKWSSIF